MKQHPFEWVEEPEQDEQVEVDLPPATTKALIALMARILVHLVRPSKEANDER